MASHAVAAPIQTAAVPLHAPSVLVVDGDPVSLAHCCAMLDELGYHHYGVGSGREALERLHHDTAIQIVLVDLHMPAMDCFTLIEEARARAGDARAIAAILLAAKATTEMAVRGLHVEAVDLLAKPVGLDAYSTALRRAMRYLSARRPTLESSPISDMNSPLARAVSMLEGQSREPRFEGKLADKDISATLRMIIQSRSLRNRFFPSELFADPAWDVLLDLTRARLDDQQVSVSSVCIAASVPMSTALRWVRQMTDAGLLRRWTDPKDRRRDLIALTDTTTAHMREYLEAVHVMLQKI